MDIEFGSKAVQYVRLLPKYLEGNGKALEVQLVLPALNIKVCARSMLSYRIAITPPCKIYSFLHDGA